MADDQTTWKLNLDVSDALDSLGQFQSGMSGLGDTESLSGLASKFTEFGLVLGGVAAAVFAIKEAMDGVFEGEQIAAVNQQFETLSENAGIAGDKLKEGLVAAAGGLVDDTSLLQAANKGIVELGNNAKDLDQVMVAARQASAVMGGDVAQNFTQMTQAIASGQTRALRSMGIIIDQKQAYDDYAKSIGVATNELSKEGQQHAIMNALLAKSKDAFEGVDANSKQATNAFEAFKNTLIDLKDIFLLVFEKTLGPALTTFFNNLRNWTGQAKDWMNDNFGQGADQAAAHMKKLQATLPALQAELDKLQKGGDQGFIDKYFGPSKEAQIAKIKNQIVAAEAEINGMKKASADKAKALDNDETSNNEINLEQRRKNQEKFQKELDAIRLKNLQDEMKAATSIQQVDKINEQLEQAEKQQTADKIKKINADQTLSNKQKEALIVQTRKQSQIAIEKMDQDLAAEEQKSLDNYLQESTTTYQGISRAFIAGSQRNKLELQDFGKQGAKVFDSFSQEAVGAFEKMGAGSESAGDAIKDAFFGMIGSVAEQYGTMILLESVWPPNPIGLAAGGALIALGGFLKGQAGGGGGASVSAGVPNTADTGFGTATNQSPTVGSVQSPSQLNSVPQKTVNVTVAGNYYDSNESKQAMMDMLRQATDATDFNYYKVGGQ